MSSVFDAFLVPPEALHAFGDAAVLQAMLDVEAALAHAMAAEGVMPSAHAAAIASVCQAALYDLPAIVAASRPAGSLAIPLVRQLTQTVALYSPEAARWVHWGSTSQDITDTAVALCTRQALHALDAPLQRLCGGLLDLAEAHAQTPMLARTLMQPALVTGFGLKCLNWVAPLLRSGAHLQRLSAAALALQLGGAVGTLSVMGTHGPGIARRMAASLGLAQPDAPWHTQRDQAMRLALEATVLTGSLGKIAGDLALMGQAEVGEAVEAAGAGRGGSSAMPHKRNPVGAMQALAAAHRAPAQAATLLACMGQQHERGLGNWQAELAAWPAPFQGAHAAAAALADAVAGLQVSPGRMRQNIDALFGVVHAEAAAQALMPMLGRDGAQALLQRLSQQALAEQRPLAGLLAEAAAADPRLARFATSATGTTLSGVDSVDSLFDPFSAAAPAAALVRERLALLRAAHAQLNLRRQGPVAAHTP